MMAASSCWHGLSFGMVVLILTPLAVYSEHLALQAGNEWTGQVNDPFTTSEHPILRVHVNGTLHNLPSYEPVGIEPNLDSLGPVSGPLVHHVNSTGGPDLACAPTAGRNYTGKIVMVQRGECHFVAKVRNIQVAGAVAVIVYDNIDEGWVHMGWDDTVQPEIPSVFIQKKEADLLLAFMLHYSDFFNGIDATLLPDNENSLRFRLTSVTETPDSDVDFLEGEIDMRRTVDGHMGTDYMKYSVNGTFKKSTGAIVLTPHKWITYSEDEAIQWMGITGNMLTERHAMSGRTSPYDAIVHMRMANPAGCPARVQLVEKCQTTGENSYCGQGCLEVTDEHGYRLFNDESCEFTEPLMWYCNVNNNADGTSIQTEASFSCEGERLLLRPPLVHQANVCPAGSAQKYPFFSEWPTKRPGKIVNPFDWDQMTPDSSHGSFVTYFCNDLACTNKDFSKGWRMRGGYADSGNFQAPNSKSVLEYHLPNVAAGAEVLFSYISSGETGFDYMQFSVCMGERCQAFDDYKTVTGESWKREKLVLSQAGEYTLKWVYIKDATTDQGVDEARLLEVAITGFSDDGGCTECPADHCSMGRIDGCQACPSGAYSGVGSDTCTLCDAPLPQNSHFSVGIEFAATNCAISCDPGYQETGMGVDMQCIPRPDVCLLPFESSYDGKFDPPSFQMLKQCLALRHPIKDYCADAIATLENIQRSKQLDAGSDSREAFYTAIDKMTQDMKAHESTDCSQVFESDYEFHQKIMTLLRETNDASYIYAPPQFYQDLYVYLPVRFNYTADGNQKRIFVENPSELSRMYGTLGGKNSSVKEWLGWEVLEVDGVSAQEAFTAFANTGVGFSPDDATRFDLAVRGDMPTLWTCSFGTRSLASCGMPPTPSIEIKLKCPHKGIEKTVTLMWTTMYFGKDCDTSEPLSEAYSELGSCSSHSPKDWLNCDLYNLARTAEQGHWAYSDDDFGMEDVAVSLHHSWFPHKELMDSSALSTTSHTVHWWKQMSLTVLDSYPHIAAYAHTEGNGVKTGIMRIASFHGEASEVHAVMMELAALQPSRILIDLRTNGGGHVCHAMQLAYLVAEMFTDSSNPKAFFDFKKSVMMEMFASNQSFFSSAHPEFALAPQNFLNTATNEPFADMGWYTDGGDASNTQKVGMNCERYSSLLDYYSASTKMVTRKMLQFDKKRIQVLVNAQCIGACAVFARLASQEGFATVVGIGIDSVGTAPAAISGDIDGLVCQQKGMKLDEDKIPASQLLQPMPAKGQNLVIPMTRMYGWQSGGGQPLGLVKPDIVLPSGVPRSDFAEGFWYSGMELYCASIQEFDPSTGKYGPGCVDCDSQCSGGAGGAFFWMFIGVLLVPLFGAIAYYFQQNGCSGDSWLGLFGACAGCIFSTVDTIKELCRRVCGSRWERSYGSLSGDTAEGMPQQQTRCRDCDWRAWIPGMKGSALEEQYSDMNAGDELNSLPTNIGGPTRVIPAPMNVSAEESSMDTYAPSSEPNVLSSDANTSDRM